MSSLIQDTSAFKLSPERLQQVLAEIKVKLSGRVSAAYLFGSASSGDFNLDSDIDLILIKEDALLPFPQRAFEFADLFEIYPKLDLLVYTPEELDAQLADSAIGFWKSVRLSMQRIH